MVASLVCEHICREAKKENGALKICKSTDVTSHFLPYYEHECMLVDSQNLPYVCTRDW